MRAALHRRHSSALSKKFVGRQPCGVSNLEARRDSDDFRAEAESAAANGRRFLSLANTESESGKSRKCCERLVGLSGMTTVDSVAMNH
jgi:hypothetical protein